jgi:pilus assembly protein CpaF
MSADPLAKVRRELRAQLRERVDARGLSAAPRTERRLRVREEALTLMRERGALLPQRDLARVVNEVSDEVVGFGPIEFLLKDPDVTEVMVNGPDDVYVEREGRIERVEDRLFEGEESVLHLIERIVGPLGLRVDQASPWVDARLPGGSRVHAIVPPLSLRGPVLTIRTFAPVPLTGEDIVRQGSIGPRGIEFLSACVRGRANLVVSGGAGSGKTTLLGILSAFIPDDERLITIEDAAELRLNRSHVVALEARPPNVEGRGQVTVRDLVRNALRMRPDRIIVGEVRGGEALDMLQGDEHRTRRITVDGPRELLQAPALATGDDGDDVRRRAAGRAHPEPGRIGDRRRGAARASPRRAPGRLGDRGRRRDASWRACRFTPISILRA